MANMFVASSTRSLSMIDRPFVRAQHVYVYFPAFALRGGEKHCYNFHQYAGEFLPVYIGL